MNPQQYEELVCEYFGRLGYKAETTPRSNDYGVDVFAEKGQEKIAVQAKMYGGTTRKINRQNVMELHGAKDFFDCTQAIIVTNGEFLPDANTVAKKLGIDIVYLDSVQPALAAVSAAEERTFGYIWEHYISPLQGQTLTRDNGETNTILKVDGSGIERITSNGNKQTIKIEIFKQTVNKLLADGFITRDEINQNYNSRASSGIVLILAQIPFFTVTERPKGLRYVSAETSNHG
jgi:restriction system protein